MKRAEALGTCRRPGHGMRSTRPQRIQPRSTACLSEAGLLHLIPFLHSEIESACSGVPKSRFRSFLFLRIANRRIAVRVFTFLTYARILSRVRQLADETPYGKVRSGAVRAAMHSQSLGVSPTEAWDEAVGSVFPDSESSRKKGCPRAAFLGLCEEGIVRGVPVGHYTRSRKNKTYAIAAYSLLIEDRRWATDEGRLWRGATQDIGIKPNEQTDVVLSLWKSNSLVCSSN